MNNKPLIIAGAGNSIPFNKAEYYTKGCGLPLQLQTILANNYSIGLNYFFQFGCETTLNCSVDWQFYEDNKEVLKEIPMIVSAHDPQLKNHKISRIHDNTLLLKASGKYAGKDSWKQGFYTKQLVGMFALTLGIALGFKEIYLLGYDCCEVNEKTHFYQDVADLNKHTPIYIKGEIKNKRNHFRGIGKNAKDNYKTSTYNNITHLNNKWYAPYHAERKQIKIYNVSEDSVINTFPKITYEDFFNRFENNDIDQNTARTEIKNFILRNTDDK